MATGKIGTSPGEQPRDRAMYDGFISYSHAADDLLAPRLQAGLQRFAKPWWKRRALRIFRDESSLAANPHLWSSITEALDSSDWFVLLLSEDAASSEWVGREIEHWVAYKDPDRILPVVTGGEFGWNSTGDVGGSSVPPALQGVFSEEPRWVDLRFARGEEQLDLKNPLFSSAVADIASAIRGVPKDELASEEVRQHRRTLRTVLAAGVVMLFLAVGATLAAVLAVSQSNEARLQRDEAQRLAESEAEARNEAIAQRQEAESQRAEAEAQGRVAVARGLLASSTAVVDEDPELAVMLALEGVSELGDPRGFGVLREALGASTTIFYRGAEGAQAETGLFEGGISPDGTRVAIGGVTRIIEVRQVVSGDLVWSHQFDRELWAVPSFVNDGTEVAVVVGVVGDEAGIPDAGIHVFDAESGRLLRTFSGPSCGYRPSGGHIEDDAVLSVFAPAAEWEAEHGCPLQDEQGFVVGQLFWFDVNSGESSPVGPMVVVANSRTPEASRDALSNRELFHNTDEEWVEVTDLATGESLMRVERIVFSSLLSPDGLLALLGGYGGVDNGAIRIFEVESGEEIAVLEGHPGGTLSMVFTDGGKRLISTGVDGTVKIWDMDLMSPLSTVPVGSQAHSLTLSSDSSRLSVVGADSITVQALDAADRAEVGVFEACDGVDGFYLTGGLEVRSGRVMIWTACNDVELRAHVFDYETRDLIGLGPAGTGQGAALSHDGRFVAHQILNLNTDPPLVGTVAVTDVDSGTEVRMEGLCEWTGPLEGEACQEAPDEPYAAWSEQLAFSPDGTMLAYGPQAGGPGRVWDPTTGKTRAVWDFALVAFSPDSKLIATVSLKDLNLEVRETHDFGIVVSKPLTRLDLPNNIRFMDDGQTLIASVDSDLIVYQASTLDALNRIGPLHESLVRHITVSTLTPILATAGQDGFVKVFDTSTSQLLHEIPLAITDRVQAVAFANKDQHLVATTPAGPAIIYTLDDQDLLAIARARLVRGLTDHECDLYFPDTTCPTLEDMATG